MYYVVQLAGMLGYSKFIDPFNSEQPAGLRCYDPMPPLGKHCCRGVGMQTHHPSILYFTHPADSIIKETL